jgi:flagellin
MAISASTNTTANTALRYLNANSVASANSLAKLSSGSRIVKASDDAASLAIGTKIKADVTALKQAQVNASQASSVLQVADGAMAQTTDILMRMKALSVQAQSGSVSDNERGFLDKEFQALVKQVDAIAAQTKFNGNTLLGGTFGATLDTDTVGATDVSGVAGLEATGILLAGDTAAGVYQLAFDEATNTLTLTNTTTTASQALVLTETATDEFTGQANFSDLGVILNLKAFATNADIAADTDTQFTVEANETMSFQVGVAASDSIEVNLASIKADALGVGGASVKSAANAIDAGNMIDAAIALMNTARADVGAGISRFEFASANVANTIENLDAARSVLMDVDMAAEMSNFSSKQVMLQASVAMLAQANQQPQQLLRLLN